jgi:hypothetical protein
MATSTASLGLAMGLGTTATVSVVVGANAAADRLEPCLAALEPQREGVEVLVQSGEETPAALRERFPWARFTHTPGQLVPQHWRDGIDAAAGEIVALTIAQMVPAPDWIATIRRLHVTHDVVGGAVEPGESLRLVDWAEYFCRYARDMLPFCGRGSDDLPGDNAAYARPVLEGARGLYREGFWEPDVHRKLTADGVTLWQTPDLRVAQGRSAGFSAFFRQRVQHGRSHGRQRGVRVGRGQNLVRLLAAPLVPFVMTVRVLRLVFGKRRHRCRLLAALPLVLAFNAAWGLSEGLGHLDELRRR